MIKCFIACIAVTATVFAAEMKVRLLPEEDLADLIQGNPTLLISGSNIDGRSLFSAISTHIGSILPTKNTTFKCLDFKFMSSDDFSDICHNHIFVNKGSLDIIAHGSKLGNGSFHVNLYLPAYIPVDEDLLIAPFQTAYEKLQLSSLTTTHATMSRLMKKTFLMPERHPLLNLSDNTDIGEIEEKTWLLEFATFSMLYDLKARLKEFLAVDPISYGKVFDLPIQLVRTIPPRTYLYYLALCEKHITVHLRGQVASKDKKLTEKSSMILDIRREYHAASNENSEMRRVIQDLTESNALLLVTLKTTEDDKEDLYHKYESLQSDCEEASEKLVEASLELVRRSEKVEELEKTLIVVDESIGFLKQKLADSEKIIENSQGCIASQRGLIKSLHTSCELGVSFTNLIDMPTGPEEMRNMVKWTHVAARFESLGELSEYDERNLGPEEKKVMRRLWLETYYAEGVRLRNWLSLAKSGSFRDIFMFEACYTTILEDYDEEKVKRKLAKMKNDIIRLESRVMELIDALQEKCKDATEHEDITAFKIATEQNANSALDVEIYIKAFNFLHQ